MRCVPASKRCGGGRNSADSIVTVVIIDPPVRNGGRASSTLRRPYSTPIPVGASILCPEKTARSTSSARRSTGMCGTDWQASSTTSAPTSRARAITGPSGATPPSTLETCASATTRVRSVITSPSVSSRSAPWSSTGMKRSVAPVRSASCCHGIRLEWCSDSVTTISSPSRTRMDAGAAALPRPYATRFSPSVALDVHTISPASTPTKRATFSRASSNSSVARAASVCAPRWTAALRCSRYARSASSTWRGFWDVAAESR
ncbi:hypothetical protein CMMCAS06_04685 [Clavibacter michiganensis subsp. michiganensis]|nr:hypothetical protein CMMCAS06_04685 [Clavibacter michiganensis subsp. michiganensis]